MIDSSLFEGQTATKKEIVDFFSNSKMPFMDSTPIPLHYLIQALYPKAYQNLLDNFEKQYMKGYLQGKEDASNEDS